MPLGCTLTEKRAERDSLPAKATRRGRPEGSSKQHRYWKIWPDFLNTRVAHFLRFKTKPSHQFNCENGIKTPTKIITPPNLWERDKLERRKKSFANF